MLGWVVLRWLVGCWLVGRWLVGRWGARATSPSISNAVGAAWSSRRRVPVRCRRLGHAPPGPIQLSAARSRHDCTEPNPCRSKCQRLAAPQGVFRQPLVRDVCGFELITQLHIGPDVCGFNAQPHTVRMSATSSSSRTANPRARTPSRCLRPRFKPRRGSDAISECRPARPSLIRGAGDGSVLRPCLGAKPEATRTPRAARPALAAPLTSRGRSPPSPPPSPRACGRPARRCSRAARGTGCRALS